MKYHVTFSGRRKGSIGLTGIGWTTTVEADTPDEAMVKVRLDFDVFKMIKAKETIEPDNRFDPYWEALRKGE